MGSLKLYRTGAFTGTVKRLNKLSRLDFDSRLNSIGQQGVSMLSSNTPIDTGETASSWSYKLKKTSTGVTLEFHNSKEVAGVPLAVLLHYGHGTGTGGFVTPTKFISQPFKEIFEELARRIEEVLES